MSKGVDINKKFASVAPPKKHDKLVALFADLPALDCLKKLNDFGILSAPVFEDADHKKFVGILDVIDLAAYALQVYDDVKNASEKETLGTWQMIFENGLRKKNAKELINFSKANYCRPVDHSASFKDILDTLAAKGVHRVPVLKADGHFERLVTQSEVLRFVSQHLDDFGSSLNKSVLMAGLVGKATIYVTDKQPVLDAFKAIIEKKISAVAVLDDKQKLVGNISVRDLRSVIRERPDMKLKETVAQFLASGGKAPSPVTIGADSTVRNAISKMTSSAIHRVYVVDEHNFPQGVISITDIFGFLLRAGFDAEPSQQPKKEEVATVEQAAQKVGLPAEVPKDHHLNILDQAFQIMFPEFKNEDELVFVLGDAPAEEVVKRLREKKVACVPVIDPVKRVDNHPRVHGLADITDIATVAFDLKKHPHAKDAVTFADLHDKKLKGVLAKDIINSSGLNQAAILGVQTRLMDVFAALTIPAVHRVPVMTVGDNRGDKKSHAVGKFVTQTQVLRFMATHLDDFGPVLEKTVIAARVGVFKPKCINVKATALEGFHTLVKEKVSGLPVVDDNYKVLGSLSTTDLRLVVMSKPSININKPISEFWEDVKGDESYAKPLRVITCSYTNTVHQVITKLHSNQVHRLFIVDERGLLIGVVSLSDVLKYVLKAGSQF